MLTPVILRDTERAALTGHETFALEYLLLDRLSADARDKRSGDVALMLAIRATDYLEPLSAELGDIAADLLVEHVRESEVGQAAVERVSVFASLSQTCAA